MTTPERDDAAEWIRGIVDRFQGPLTLYAARITGDDERARDVVQETFLRLCGQPRHSVEDFLAEWLFTVCRNQALDVRRKETRVKTLTQDEASRRPSPGAAPAEALERKECHFLILDEMERLSTNQREVLRLKFQGGLSYKEISRVTQLTVGNVGFLIHTGLKKIRDRLAGERPGFAGSGR